MFKSINPATGEQIATHAELTPAQLEEKLVLAAKAFAKWRLSPIPERCALLGRLAEQYEQNKDRLARMATLEMGKTLTSAIAEVEKCAALFKHMAQNGAGMLAGQQLQLANGGSAETQWQPLGVVLAIMPWNFPYWQAVRFLAPAILAGNVGLLKHASLVQGCAALMEEMVLAAGGAPGLFQNLAIKSDAVAKLIEDTRVAAVTLTGSEGAGSAVAAQAGKFLKKTVLELGGSDPFIVMPSADLEAAVKAAVTARIQNAGQSCICGKRMIVHKDIYAAFREKFVAALHAVKMGDPLQKETQLGPLSSLEQRETVLKQLEKAKTSGAKLEGGEVGAGKGAFMQPGILEGIQVGSPMMAEEIFGPIAMLLEAKDVDDALRIANAIPFGLGSAVFTQDKTEQQRFIRDIEAGMVAINQLLSSAPEAPFGGIKRSGYGRELGPWGLHEFMNLKTVLRPKAA